MDQKKGLRNAFSVAHDANDEQKRDHDLEMVRDREEREALRVQKADRDRLIELQESFLADERRKMANEAITKELGPEVGRDYTPDGMEGLSLEAREKLIRWRVERDQGPIDALRIEGVRYDLNRQLDTNIEAARQRDRDRSTGREDDSQDQSL